MDLMRSRLLFFILLPLLALAALQLATRAHLCFSDHEIHGDHQHANSTQHLKCPASTHSLAYFGLELSALFILPLIGLFFLTYTTFVPEGLVLSRFKPPQFAA